jgi:putative peptidoglycan lipid II flippase
VFTGPRVHSGAQRLCVRPEPILFPIVVLLGLNGLAVGILNAHDHFTIPAIAPLVWNMVIIAGMIGSRRCSGPNKIYAYAIGVVLARSCSWR